MRSLICFIMLAFLATPIFAQESSVRVRVREDHQVKWYKIPMPVGTENAPSELKDKEWHRRVVGSYEILALDDQQGQFLKQNIPAMKPWVATRWGLPDSAETVPVRMMVVPNKDLMKKLFRLEETRVELFRDYEGQKLHVVYLLFDGPALDSVTEPLTRVSLGEYEKRNNISTGFWFHRGMSKLNTSLNFVRTSVAALNNNQRLSAQQVLAMTEQEWYKLDVNQKKSYDNHCLAMCLLLRKEFGQKNLHYYLHVNSANPEKAISSVYGFSGFSEFDKSYQRYVVDIVNAVSTAPDHYLQIAPAKQ